MGIGNSFDTFDVRICGILEAKLAIQQSIEILFIIVHDFAHEHILKAEDGPWIFCCNKRFKSFVEVGVGGLIVLVLGVENA